MKNKKIITILLTIVVIAIAYYFWLPPINLSSYDFWIFLLFSILIYFVINIFNTFSFNDRIINFVSINKNKDRKYLVTSIIIGSVFALILVINIFNTPLFDAKGYANRIKIDDKADFNKDIKEVDFNSLPLLDKDSSSKLGDRVMGQMPELVSQFEVSDLYTQINYNDDIVRVTSLEYASPIKWFTNRKSGVKGYIVVNSVDGKAELKKLDKGMKYMPSALLNENLYRKLRFSYPTEIFGKIEFEIDNEGNPYWVVPTIKYSGVGMKKEIKGAIILDPITGKSKNYKVKDIPKWIDHVYSADLIMEQIDDWGTYKNGFLNSIFGQKNVVLTTSGYNYTVMNDDVYLYTGITSVSKDQATVGFVLSNLRTKETKFYKVPGAEEKSAMASAEGQVQQMNYTSTFPLLINLNGKPTYLVSLKDNAGLVKMYGFVDVKDYQKVVVTDASKGIEVAAKNYLGDDKIIDDKKSITKEITIDNISSVIIDGNTYYYIMDKEGKKYRVSIKVNSDKLPFIKKDDKIKIEYKLEKDVTEITKIVD